MAKSTDSLSFECPRCQTMITVGAEAAGQTLACNNCGGNIVVPGTKPPRSDAFDDLFAIEEPSPPATPPTAAPSSPAGPTAEAGDAALPIIEPEVADSAWELFPEALPAPQPLAPAKDPFAKDENAPLRVDEFSGEVHLPSQIRVKCPICDSVLFASESMIGKQVQCSDCYSMIDVIAPVKESAPGPKPLDQSTHESDEQRLSAFPELDSDLATEPVGEEYGLAPASEDLLRPRVEALPPEIMDLVQQSYQVPIAPAPGTPPPTPAATPAASPKKVTAPAAAPRPAHVTLPATEAELPHVEAPPPPMERMTPSQLFKWPEQFLAIFKDLNALQFLGIVAVMLSLGYVVIDWALWLISYRETAESPIQPYRVFGYFALMFAGAIHFFAMFLSAIMVNQAVEGAAHKRSLFNPPELGVMELVSSFLVVGVSFWAGMLPGIVLGQLFWGATRWWSLMFVGAFGTAFLLAPIGILGAYYNGSAFQILSSDVLRSVGRQTAGWIRFYSWMGVWIVVFCLAWVFRAIPVSLIGGTMCGVVQAASILLMGRTIGLLAQAFINFWIEDQE